MHLIPTSEWSQIIGKARGILGPSIHSPMALSYLLFSGLLVKLKKNVILSMHLKTFMGYHQISCSPVAIHTISLSYVSRKAF